MDTKKTVVVGIAVGVAVVALIWYFGGKGKKVGFDSLDGDGGKATVEPQTYSGGNAQFDTEMSAFIDKSFRYFDANKYGSGFSTVGSTDPLVIEINGHSGN